MDNMSIYNKVRNVPKTAQKQIGGGRLKGMTDINPMWRIEQLTEMFGACGFGWYYEITSQWLEKGQNDDVCAFVNINLYIKQADEWSKPIQGTGGASFSTKEKSGFYTSDECYKMALTDAISVACKALGFGADVYWQSGATKYQKNIIQSDDKKTKIYKCCDCGEVLAGCNDEMYARAAAQSVDGKVRCKKCREAMNNA